MLHTTYKNILDKQFYGTLETIYLEDIVAHERHEHRAVIGHALG